MDVTICLRKAYANLNIHAHQCSTTAHSWPRTTIDAHGWAGMIMRGHAWPLVFCPITPVIKRRWSKVRFRSDHVNPAFHGSVSASETERAVRLKNGFFWPFCADFVTFWGHSEIPSMIRDRFENFLEILAPASLVLPRSGSDQFNA
jgi:hypothetical protein